jgi:HAD superfamily hydrolase (TIGR01490 family)
MMHSEFNSVSQVRTVASTAAFFDVDNTLLPGTACEIRFFGFLWRRELVGWRELGESVWWLLRKSRFRTIHPLRERKLYLRGKKPLDIEALAREFCQLDIIPSISKQGLQQLEEHRRLGHHIILVTGAPDFLMAPLATYLKVSTVFAAQPVQQNSIYTGELTPPLPYGPGKQKLILAHVLEEHIDLSNSFAYGDSPGDVEILQLVGHPTVVNPIRGMRRLAERRGWPIAQWI